MKGRPKRKHRWKLKSTAVTHTASGTILSRTWRCRRCGIEVVIHGSSVPLGTYRDSDGNSCGDRIVNSVMSS